MLTRFLKRLRARDARAGFSQIEFLVSTATVSLMFAGLHSFYRSQVFTIRTEEVVINLKQEVDVGVDFLVKELRSAGARPEGWPGGGCSGAATKPASCESFERIRVAGPTQVEFQYDYVGASSSVPDGCPIQRNERVRYFLNTGASGNEIRRRVILGTGATEEGILVDNVPAGGFSLTYFDRAGNLLAPDPSTGLLTEAARRSVGSIDISIRATERNPTPGLNNDFSFARATRVFLRNERHC